MRQPGMVESLQWYDAESSDVADSVCPFCYVGYKRVQQAIQSAKEEQLPLDFSISFAPFQLDPTMAEWPKSEVKMERYEKKFGKKPVADMIEAMKE